MILAAARSAGLSPHQAEPRNTIVDKAERDELAYVLDDDPNMAAAVRKARSSLKNFLELAQNPPEGMEGFAVKVALCDGCDTEYFWIHPFEQHGDRFSGVLNNTPRSIGHVKMGDTIHFTQNEIVDWMYLYHGAMRGNYSAQAMLKSATPEEREAFRKRFGLEFDL